MKEVYDKIAILLEEREELLKDKESNRKQIWMCEQEIYMYTHLYDTLSQLMLIKRKNIESYLDLIDYRKNNLSLTWPGLIPGYSHILPMIDHMQEEYDNMHSECIKSKKIIELYAGKKEALEIRNKEIDERLEVIDNELGIKQAFVKKLEIDKGE